MGLGKGDKGQRELDVVLGIEAILYSSVVDQAFQYWYGDGHRQLDELCL